MTRRDEHGFQVEGTRHALQSGLEKFWMNGCQVEMPGARLRGAEGEPGFAMCELRGQPGIYGGMTGCEIGSGYNYGPGGQELLGTVDETGRDVLVCQAHKAVLAERVSAARLEKIRAYEEETAESYRAMLAFQERTEAETEAFKARREPRKALGGGDGMTEAERDLEIRRAWGLAPE